VTETRHALTLGARTVGEQAYYQAVLFAVSAVRAAGGADQVIPMLQDLLDRLRDGGGPRTAPYPAVLSGGA
jgi:hypothetical protein